MILVWQIMDILPNSPNFPTIRYLFSLSNLIFCYDVLTDYEGELERIWQRNPCHVVKAKISNFTIHQGSFHSLKKGGIVNDEVCQIFMYAVAYSVYYVYL